MEPLPKSRWCVRRHQEPDSEDLRVYAPTPQSESIMAVLRAISSLKWDLEIADAKNAFCQSDRLVRPKGSIFVEPCEGLGLESGSLIELVAPVYGLNDAPILWHRTLTEWLVSQGCRKSLVEPCPYVKHETGSLVGLALVEVDDLILSFHPSEGDRFVKEAQERFKFGKWKIRETEFAGRGVRQMSD